MIHFGKELREQRHSWQQWHCWSTWQAQGHAKAKGDNTQQLCCHLSLALPPSTIPRQAMGPPPAFCSPSAGRENRQQRKEKDCQGAN